MIETALRYASMGLSVIPIAHGDKIPLVGWKEFQKRRATPEEITRWFTTWPQANIGFVTGEISGVVVLDLDGGDGEESAKRHGLDLKSGVRVRTGSGFWHFYFRRPHTDLQLSNFARKEPGLDFRGDGGYVVAPPSIHKNGAPYSWVGEPLLSMDQVGEAPQWLLKLVLGDHEASSGPPETKEGGEWIQKLAAGVSDGERNASAARIAGGLIQRGLARDETLCVLNLWNAANKPPLPTKEVESVVDSILKKHEARGRGHNFTIRELSILKTKPPTYALEVEFDDGFTGKMTVNASVLLSPNRFKVAALEDLFRVVSLGRKWESFISKALETAKLIEAPPDSGENSSSEEMVEAFISKFQSSDLEALGINGRCAYVDDGKVYVRGPVLHKFLIDGGSKITRPQLWLVLKGMGWSDTTIRGGEKGPQTIRVWFTALNGRSGA